MLDIVYQIREIKHYLYIQWKNTTKERYYDLTIYRELHNSKQLKKYLRACLVEKDTWSSVQWKAFPHKKKPEEPAEMEIK